MIELYENDCANRTMAVFIKEPCTRAMYSVSETIISCYCQPFWQR